MIIRRSIMLILISVTVSTGTAGLGRQAAGQSGTQVPVTFEPRTYRMVSVPVELFDKSFEGVLFDDYGPYNINIWRLFHYNSIQNRYDEYPNTGVDFSRGTAVWLVNQDGTSFDIGEESDTNIDSPIPIIVFPGWNQIGMPFPFPIACRTLLDQASELVPQIDDIEGPVSYDGAEFHYNVNTCDPWQGYFIFIHAVGDEPIPLLIPPLEPSGGPSKRTTAGTFDPSHDYMVRFSAEIEHTGLRDSQNYIGFLRDASDGEDENDFREAPPIGEFVRFSIVEDGKRFAGNFKTINETGHSWRINIQSSRSDMDIVVSLEESGLLPAGFKTYILDRDYRTVVPVENNIFSIRLRSKASERHLSVVIGTEQFALENTDGISLLPLEYELLQNFPNPFGPETAIRYRLGGGGIVSLRIYNALGQVVRRLDQGYQDAGTHAVSWDGKDEAGVAVASGIYLYRLDSPEFTDTRKMTLIR